MNKKLLVNIVYIFSIILLSQSVLAIKPSITSSDSDDIEFLAPNSIGQIRLIIKNHMNESVNVTWKISKTYIYRPEKNDNISDSIQIMPFQESGAVWHYSGWCPDIQIVASSGEKTFIAKGFGFTIPLLIPGFAACFVIFTNRTII